MNKNLRLVKALLLFVVFLISSASYAQALNESQILSRLNTIIRTKGVDTQQQIQQLDTLIASASALRAEGAENAVQAYKLLVSSKAGEYDVVKMIGNSVLAVAVRGQDYRSQSYALRALMRYQAVVSPTDVMTSKQQLIALLPRRLNESDQAHILLDIGQTDITTGNVMSALDFLNQAQNAFWQLSDYLNWRKVIEAQVELMVEMQWFSKAQKKEQELVNFLQNQSGQMPFKLTDQLLSLMAAEYQWERVEDIALKMLNTGIEADNVQAQFIAGYWLMHVNLQQHNFELVERWNTKLENWLQQNPQLEEPLLLRLDKVAYLISKSSLPEAEALQSDISIETLKSQGSSYLTIRQHLLNQVELAKAYGDLANLASAYEMLVNWVEEERNRVLELTMDQVSEDFAAMQQSSQKEIISLNKALLLQKSTVNEESLFNNLLIGIIGVLLIIIAIVSYFYIRLKNQKQSQRRQRRLARRR